MYVISKLFFLYLYSYFVKDCIRFVFLSYSYLKYLFSNFPSIFFRIGNLKLNKYLFKVSSKSIFSINSTISVIKLILIYKFSIILTNYRLIRVN